MGDSSVYVYYKPLILLCYILGHFPVVNVLTNNPGEMRIKAMSLSVSLSLSLHTLVFSLLDFPLLFQDSLSLFDVIKLCADTLLFLSCLWFTCYTQRVIKAFQTVDRLNFTLAHFPKNIMPKNTEPNIFSKVCLALLIVSITLPAPTCWFWKMEDAPYSSCLIASLISELLPIRVILILSCIFYSCYLGIYDSKMAWYKYCWINCRPFSHLQDFCQLLFDQNHMLKEIERLLQVHVLFLFVQGVTFVLFVVPYTNELEWPVLLMATSVGVWTSYLGVLVLCIRLCDYQYERLGQEILAMAVRDMTWRDYCKVRLMLDQLQRNPGEFSAAGFFKVDMKLIHSFLVLGIEFCIMFAQNQSLLKEIAGFAVSSSMPPSNVTVK